MTSRRSLARTALVALTGLAVVFALVAMLVVRSEQKSVAEQFDARDAATAAATRALPRILGYRHETIAEDLDAASDRMTDDFAEDYLKLASELTAVAQQRKVDVVATVRGIAALECGQECSAMTVRLLAFVDQHRTIAGEPASSAPLSAVVTMVLDGGDWKVDDLTTS